MVEYRLDQFDMLVYQVYELYVIFYDQFKNPTFFTFLADIVFKLWNTT